MLFVKWWWIILNGLKHGENKYPDKPIAQHAFSQLQCSIWIQCLNYLRTCGIFFWILIITSLTQWPLATHFGYRISPTGGISMRKCTQCMLISVLWHAIYSTSYHKASMWRQEFRLRENVSAGGSNEPQVTPFTKLLLQDIMLTPITVYSHAMTQHLI